jgi:hypothetical protein
MDTAVKWLLDYAGKSPLVVSIVFIGLLAVHYGPAYINAISDARSRKRRDDVELLEKELRLRDRLEWRKNKRSK